PYNPANAVMRAKAGETTLDVEVSHAMAPGASIVLAETPGTTSQGIATGGGGVKFFLNAAGRPVAPVAAWNDTYAQASPVPWASNGGVSAIFGRPSYQDPVRGIVGNRRGVPDISLSAALSAGVLVYGSFPGNGFPFNGWIAGGGTSEATPEFAGIVAIADQFAGRRLGLVNPALD